ncbi:MAG: hypothetical protein V4773_17295 [Verrucomicrobiota bacterium]
MSIAELKATADKLTAKERAWLKAYLCAKERASDPAWRAEMSRRLKSMRAGNGISSEEYYRRVRAIDRNATRKRKAA